MSLIVEIPYIAGAHPPDVLSWSSDGGRGACGRGFCPGNLDPRRSRHRDRNARRRKNRRARKALSSFDPQGPRHDHASLANLDIAVQPSAQLPEENQSVFRWSYREGPRTVECRPQELRLHAPGPVGERLVRNPRCGQHRVVRCGTREDSHPVTLGSLRAANEAGGQGVACESDVRFRGDVGLRESRCRGNIDPEVDALRFGNEAVPIEQVGFIGARLDRQVLLQRRWHS